MRRKPDGLLVCVLFSVLIAVVAAQEPDQSGGRTSWPSPFILAVYGGGDLLPIARFTGREWVNTWPPPEEAEVPVPKLPDVPVTWLGMRVPIVWKLWFSTGGAVHVTVVGMDRSGGCVVSPQLLLDESPRSPNPAYDVVHEGVAAAGADVEVEPVRLIKSGDLERRELESTLRGIFTAHEREAVSRSSGDHPNVRERLSAAKMAGASIDIDWVFSSSAKASPLVYRFEVAKREPPGQHDVTMGIRVAGWLWREPDGRLTPVGVKGEILWDEGGVKSEFSDVPDDVPLGVLRDRDTLTWVMEWHAGESGGFELVSVSRHGERRILNVDAGGC